MVVEELSVAEAVTGGTADPDTEVWAVVTAGVTTFTTSQPKAAVPETEASSVTVTTTAHEHAVVGVPVTAPVDGSMDSPAGRPVADQVRVAVEDESAAGTSTVVMRIPTGRTGHRDWSPSRRW